MTKEQKFLEKAFRKMFGMVGRNYTKEKLILKHNNEWFLSSSWTDRQEREFAAWMVAELKKDLGYNSTQAKRETSYFLFNYGWKSK